MKPQTKTSAAAPAAQLTKADPDSPVLKVTGRESAIIKAGTTIDGTAFENDTAIVMPAGGLERGADYAVMLGFDNVPQAIKLLCVVDAVHFAGFHFAPGGNAPERAGGDNIPAINPWSMWDLKYRPNGDPRGQFLVDGPRGLEWLDIYKLGKDHLINGTSKFGVTIADGKDPPQNPAGGYFDRLDYATAVAVMKHHGKTLAAVDTLFIAAYGVTEKTALGIDPKITGLDAPRTSQRGMMQSSGSMWDWCHDGDPDTPRASIFGGSWIGGPFAGSRFAIVDYWPENSDERLGARGRSDHLQLVSRRDSGGIAPEQVARSATVSERRKKKDR